MTERRIGSSEAAEQIRRHVRHEDAGLAATVERWAIEYVACLLHERGIDAALHLEQLDVLLSVSRGDDRSRCRGLCSEQAMNWTDEQMESALTECGLAFKLVILERPGLYATDKRVRVRVELGEGTCTYDVLAKIAARLATTDIGFGYEAEHSYSEVTFEPSRAWLEIMLPLEIGK